MTQINTLSPMERLNQLQGLNNIREQFEKYRAAYKRYVMGETRGRFRPHMAFMGNPGTGKTTVARLFAEILHEDGLLPQGQFIEATPDDLISPYIGQTSLKTQTVCDRAKGGVLFIDEAYGLMNDFGKEAIEVLIQFMVNNDDTVVIFAGYTDEMKRFINECNPGFRSHCFNEALGFFYFEDYEPDVNTVAVDRIRNLNIDDRPIFTGLYGCLYGQEYFVENDLNIYSYWQELYRYLRGEGYTTVFYNEAYNFYSYEESQLETLFYKKPEEISKEKGLCSNPQGRYVSQFSSPNGHNRRRGVRLCNENGTERSIPHDTSYTDLVSHNPGILVKTIEHGKDIKGDQFFQLQSRERVMDRLFGFMDNNPGHKLAVIFTMPSKISFGRLAPSYHSDFQGRFSLQKYAGSGLRCLVLYDFNVVTQLYESLRQGGAFFFHTWFLNQMFPDHQEGRSDLHKPSPALFRVGSMGKDEVGNMLKRRCAMEGLRYTMSPIPFDDLCSRICQQFVVEDPETGEKTSIESVAEFMELPIPVVERTILRMDEEKAINKLKRMRGIDKLIEQFEKYLKAYHQAQKNKKGPKFRPHMALMGNPGTGKTTIARLFAEILHEEGLLPKGQFVEVGPSDLIGQYIGSTRIKAQAVCDRAQGGALFIDEAYGLMNDFGKEAIEVLIQFMENNKDSIVIVAGYPDEMKRFINDCNPGFKSRFNQDLGFFYFEDYTDEQLWEILKLKLNAAHLLMDERACEEMALNYFASLPRGPHFGNARVVDELIPILINNLNKRYVQASEEQRKDPDFAMRILPEDFPNYGEPSPMDKLNRLIGIEPIREQFERYLKMFHYCRNNPQTSIGKAFRPHMVFMGNPGTGKTTVARLFATILKEKGLLSNDSFVEVSPTDLVGLYVGQTARQARMQFERAKGGVLFIDEAYALNRGMNDYHLEALEALFKFMEDEHDTIVILAGYTNAMQDMLNDIPGLRSRFTNEFVFEDFKPNDMFEILMSKLGEHETSENFKSNMRKIIQIQFEHRDPTIWGNARTMENYATEILGNFIAKHNATGIIDTDCIPESIMVVKIKLNQ